MYLECLFCCPHMISANRFLVQTRFNKRNSGCWDFCGKCGHVFPAIACEVARLCSDVPREREELAMAASCCCPCNYCQNAIELDIIESKKKKYTGPPQAMILALPQHFANIRIASAGTNTPTRVPPQHVMVVR